MCDCDLRLASLPLLKDVGRHKFFIWHQRCLVGLSVLFFANLFPTDCDLHQSVASFPESVVAKGHLQHNLVLDLSAACSVACVNAALPSTAGTALKPCNAGCSSCPSHWRWVFTA
jgi:hypothetical protein